jgi:CRISPR-associated endonuclease Csn1
MSWRLGLDFGTNSIGWSSFQLEKERPVALNDAGVRIFSDGRNPKDKQSNAVKRREPRAARRNRDRAQNRQARLMRELIECGLMPDDEAARKALEGSAGMAQEAFDPWILRARALDEAISPYQSGRIIFHLGQRRGFKSNRKTDRADNEKGKVKEAIKRTQESLAAQNARTIGEFFGKARLETAKANALAAKGERAPQPLARVRKSGAGAKWQYDYYPTRELILDEFDQIWKRQAADHPSVFTDKARDTIRLTLAFQWPLKTPPVGKCTLLPDQPRAAKALPLSQRSRIYQEVNALRIRPVGAAEKELTLEQRDKIVDRLLHPTNKTAKLSFEQIRTLLGLSKEDAFSIESEKRKDMDADKTAAILMQEDRWGKAWFDLDAETQNGIVTRLIDEADEKALVGWLMQQFSLPQDRAERIADAPLTDGYGRLSIAAMDRLLEFLERDVTRYDEAVALAGLGDHSNFSTGELFDKGLPYYGKVLERSVAFSTGETHDSDEKRYGKIANPTVHVALNQIRAVVNDLIARFGAPDQIVVEVSRDLPLSAKGKTELESLQKDNQKANEARAAKLQELHIPNNYENRLRLRLFDEMEALGKRCVFTGEQISLEDLFTSDIQIEHLLPKSKTFDDGISNLVLCKRRANDYKANRSPFDAFGSSLHGYSWEAISTRASALPESKRWRFGPDAMAKFAEENDFLNRQLTDTRYVARLAKGYLESIYGGAPKAGGTQHVWVVPGRLTADLRWQWGLDSVLRGHNEEAAEAQKKNRSDHRHHAIDAIVIGLTDRSMVKAASDAAKLNHDKGMRLFDGLKEPWENFRDDVRRVLEKLVVSYKPDHGFQDAMHNDTAYGLLKGDEGAPDKRGARTVVTRKPLDGGFDKSEDLDDIRNEIIRAELREATLGLTGSEFKAALVAAGEAMNPPVRRVRITQTLNVIPIHDKKTGTAFKAYKGDSNYCYDIWLDAKGKWTGEVVSTFDAYQRAQRDADWWRKPVSSDGRPLVMRLRKNDMLQIEHEDRVIFVQVYKFSDGRIYLAEHFESDVSNRVKTLKTLKDTVKAPSALQAAKARRVTVSPSGHVKLYS